MSIEGSVIVERKDANEAFYRQKVSASDLLSGAITPPPQADILYRALNSKASGGAVYGINRAPSSATGYGDDSLSASPGVGRSVSVSSAGRYGNPGGYGGSQTGLGRSASNAANYNNNGTSYNSYKTGSALTEEKERESEADALPRYTPSAVRKPVAGRVSTDNSGYPATHNQNIANIANSTGPRIPPRIGAKPDVVTALFDYNGEQPTDLSFKKGDVITVVKKTDSRNDWWTGKCQGREGSFPANYTQ